MLRRPIWPLVLVLGAGCDRAESEGADVPIAPRELSTTLPAVKVVRHVDACAPLSPLPPDASEAVSALRPLAEVAREASCHPELFGLSDADALALIGASESEKITIRRHSVRIDPKGPIYAHDVAKAFGIESPKMKLAVHGRSLQFQFLDPEGKRPSPWGVGELDVFVTTSAKTSGERDALRDIPESAGIQGGIKLVMPDGVLEYEPDGEAGLAIGEALRAIAKDTSWLAKDPDVAHAGLPTLGDRYALTRWSSSSRSKGDRQGFHVRPRRTELTAAALATELGLSSPEQITIDVHDANPVRLANGGPETFEWNGLELEVQLSKREEGGSGLAAWKVDWVQVGEALQSRRPAR